MGLSVLRDSFLVPVRDSFLTLLCSPVVTTLRVCLPRALALRQVLAEGALESPSILILAFHSSLSFVEGSSDGLAASVRALLDGCVSLTPFVLSAVAFARTHSLGLTVDFCRIQWHLSSWKLLRFPCGWSFFSSLSGSSTVDFFPVFPRALLPGVVMASSHGFRLRRFGRLVLLAPRSLLRPVVPLRLLASPQSSVCAMRVWGPPLFPHQTALLG